MAEVTYGNILGLTTELQSTEVSINNSLVIETQFGSTKTTAKNFSAIKDGDNVLTFDVINQEWIPINNKEFETKGMTDLSNIIQNTTKIIKTTQQTNLTSGKQFSKPLNFRAFKTISNISVV